MGMSLQLIQRPNQRMIQTELMEFTLEEFLLTWNNNSNVNSELSKGLEAYFSPTKSEKLKKDFAKYLSNELFDLKNSDECIDQYLSLILSFQFTAPLLNLLKEDSFEVQNELSKFKKIMRNKYGMDSEPRMKFQLKQERQREYYEGKDYFVSEEEAMKAYVRGLDLNFEGKREVKDAVYYRLKQEGIEAVKRWQHEKKNFSMQSYVALSEAFGRSIVIPSFFSFKDDKLVNFYRSSAEDISYFIEVPETMR